MTLLRMPPVCAAVFFFAQPVCQASETFSKAPKMVMSANSIFVSADKEQRIVRSWG
jgi:hypothetical protein